MSGPGRNDPCPCGSGRKFKHCCLAAAGDAEQRRVRVRRAEGRVVMALLTYALDTFGKAFFEEAWLEFWSDKPPQDAEQFSDVPEFDAMFVPWFVTAFVRDPHGDHVEPHWPDVPVGVHWLEAGAGPVETLEREWLVQACASPLSVFVVEAVEPGRSVDLGDLLTGRRFHVLEQQGTRGLSPRDLYFARVVTAGGVSVMFGAAPYVFPARFHLEALQWRDTCFARRTPTRLDLFEYDIEIRDLYHAFADRLKHPTPPRLRNTDGDEFVPTTLTYALTAPVSDVFSRLLPLATIGAEEHVSDVVEDDKSMMTSAVLSWVKAGNRKMKNWNNTILGTLRLEPGRLVVEVNSARRADRIGREIGKRLGQAATLSLRSTEDMPAHMAKMAAQAPRGERVERRPEESRPAELLEVEDELYREHLTSWIDTRVPVLGNRTPRAASRTARGRERLDALLAGFEGGRDDDRPARKDARAALRRTLGLDR